MHAADKNLNCVNTTKHTWTEECAAERTRDRTLPQRDRTWSASVRTPTRNRNSRHECRDPNTMLQHETSHADEREHTAWAHLKPRAPMKTGHDEWTCPWCHGHKTMNTTRPKWQNPDSYHVNMDQISKECFQHLFESMPRRIKAVLKAKGGPTRY